MRGVLPVVFVVLLSASSFAQERGKSVELDTKSSSALKVTLSGSLDLDWVYRGPVINESSFWTSLGTGVSSDYNDGQDMLNGQLLINLAVDVKDKISLHSSFGNLRSVRTSTSNPVTDNLSLGDPASRSSTDLIFHDLYAQFDELVCMRFGLKIGQIRSFNVDLTGMGDSILLDFNGAESPWSSGESLTAWPETRRDGVLPGGFVGTYNLDPLNVTLALFPYVVSAQENNSFNGNEGVYLAIADYKLDTKGSKIGGLFGYLRGPNDLDTADVYNGGSVFIWGLGGVIKDLPALPSFQLFGEVYWEFGDLATVETTTATVDDIEVNALAMQFGGRYVLPMDAKPWLQAGFLYVSGEEDSSGGSLTMKSATAANDESEEFISYENNNDFLIVENQLFGLDIDNNYWGLKFKGGFEWSKIKFAGKLGFFQMVEDVKVTTKEEDGLGTEFDLGAEYEFNDSASLYLKLGWLFGSDVLELYTADEDGADTAVVFGTKVKF